MAALHRITRQASRSAPFVPVHGLDLVGPGRALTGVIGGAKGPYWQHVRRSDLE